MHGRGGGVSKLGNFARGTTILRNQSIDLSLQGSTAFALLWFGSSYLNNSQHRSQEFFFCENGYDETERIAIGSQKGTWNKI
jgi:hypothetical protein